MEGHQWGKDLSVGVEAIDAEHRLQIDLVDSLAGALERGREREVVDGLLKQLLDYTSVHFLAEELMMRLHAHPRYQAHVAEHAQLAEQLGDLEEAYGKGEVAATLDLVRALREWLAGHVRTMDRDFAAHLRQSGIGA